MICSSIHSSVNFCVQTTVFTSAINVTKGTTSSRSGIDSGCFPSPNFSVDVFPRILMVFPQVTIDNLRSSFDFFVNHLCVLLHGETPVKLRLFLSKTFCFLLLILRCAERILYPSGFRCTSPSCGVLSALLRNWDIDGWDGRDQVAKLQLVSPLLARVAPAGHLGLAGCSFPLYRLGRNPLVRLACCWLCPATCCWLCSSRFFSSSLPCSTMSAALRAHRRFQLLFPRLFGLSFSMFFSLSSYPCCTTSFFFSPLAPRLWFLF